MCICITEEDIFVHMLSYNCCLCFGPAVVISKYREAGSFIRRNQSNAFICFPYKFNLRMVKSYGRYDYEYDYSYDNDDDDEEDLDIDSDGYCSEEDLLPDLNNLKSENAKSVGKTSDPRYLRAVKGPPCPERELKHVNEKKNVLPMHETSLSSSVPSRADSSLLQHMSLNLSRKGWEKRAIKNIQQQKLIGIAVEKKKAKQKIMFKSSMPKDVKTLAESISMEKKRAEQTVMLKSSKFEDFGPLIGRIPAGKKKAEQNIMFKSFKSKHVDSLMEGIAMEKKKANQEIMIKSSKLKGFDPVTKSIAMEKKRSNQKIMLKSSKSKCVEPFTEIIATKKNTEQKNMLKPSEAEDVELTGRSKLMHSTSAIMDAEIKTVNYEQIKAAKVEDIRRYHMAKQLGYEARGGPLIQYLRSMGFKESHLARIYDRHKPALQIKVEAVRKRLDFLVSVGVKSEDLVKIITRHPQILEYTIDGKIKSHIEFLRSLGVPASRLGRILTAAPSLLSYNVELSLKPKVRFLTEEVGIERKKLGKIVVLSPQILIQSVEDSMKCRLDFLSKELGASKDSLVKMVTKHPQLLRYNIENGIKPRIDFLRSIGMSNGDIVKVLTRLTQILSLSVEKSLRPKYLYLVKELNNGVQSLITNPAYFSLSLEQRIWARHRFLISLNKVPRGPFPLTPLLVADDSFCAQWANSTLEEYEAFRKELILSNLKRQVLQKYGSCL
ncbi:transcription termination factor MTERF9, chloroplastic [Cryptomeria japonica]|uniref:transcription termination factor MTERF9, chloroplastic n=1 Tax=Cryptomeria japonica TaxID=3369 RepID=UPI0027DA62D1|nr:transcription termination factor MTERF9, chloroplastic [Cryptomeria japonica]